MNLSEGDEVVGMQLDSQGEDLLVVSEKGMGKRTKMDKFSLQHRGGKGVRCYNITDKTGSVVGSKAVNENDEIMLITTEGIVIRMSVADISEQGRTTSGVKLMDIDSNSDVMVAGIAKVREKQQKEEDSEVVESEVMNVEVPEDRSQLDALVDAAMKDAENQAE
jgi:DNA gyrase subunit A